MKLLRSAKDANTAQNVEQHEQAELTDEQLVAVSGGGFEAVLASASGAMADAFGEAESGSTSVQNTYLDHVKPATTFTVSTTRH